MTPTRTLTIAAGMPAPERGSTAARPNPNPPARNTMTAFNQDIFALAQANRSFRLEILTNEHTQIVLMSIEPGDDIGEEVHGVDQILVFVSGSGEALLGRERSSIKAHT